MSDLSTIDTNFAYNTMLAKALVQLMPGQGAKCHFQYKNMQ